MFKRLENRNTLTLQKSNTDVKNVKRYGGLLSRKPLVYRLPQITCSRNFPRMEISIRPDVFFQFISIITINLINLYSTSICNNVLKLN